MNCPSLTWIVSVALVTKRVLYWVSTASAATAKMESVSNVLSSVFIVKLALRKGAKLNPRPCDK